MTRFVRRPHWLKRFALSPVAQQTSAQTLLTFDDGPHPEFTPQVLDLLAEHRILGTFFALGKRVRQYPELAQRIVAEGHTLANHTQNHQRLDSADWRLAKQEIRDCQASILEVVGIASQQFRPPFGHLTPGLLTAALREKLALMMWSIDSGDWQCRTSEDAELCAAELRQLTRPGDIVLLHDANPHTPAILAQVLPLLGSSLQKVHSHLHHI
jgi:peptidoglycan-N-acetylglucosamine deacetylase